jgi:hypothetical protein
VVMKIYFVFRCFNVGRPVFDHRLLNLIYETERFSSDLFQGQTAGQLMMNFDWFGVPRSLIASLMVVTHASKP